MTKAEREEKQILCVGHSLRKSFAWNLLVLHSLSIDDDLSIFISVITSLNSLSSHLFHSQWLVRFDRLHTRRPMTVRREEKRRWQMTRSYRWCNQWRTGRTTAQQHQSIGIPSSLSCTSMTEEWITEITSSLKSCLLYTSPSPRD